MDTATAKKFNILIVDDTTHNIQIVANILKNESYQMAFARSGRTAIEHTKTTRFDLILLDVMMPGMDGYEVCERLKAEPATRDIPVIFLTAKADESDILKGFESGAVDYVTKPFNAAELVVRVKTHLELKHARWEIAEQKQRLEKQNKELLEAARLREDVERITRHDLKTPLGALLGYPQLIMQNEHLTKTELRYLKHIERSGYRMLNMINLSLDLFKMEKGLYQINPVPVDMIHLLENITAEEHALLQSKRQDIKVLLSGKPVNHQSTFHILGEELLCYSMLANLIKNALEASPEGECVTVTLSKKTCALIQIHNRGTVLEGIRDRFFDKYVTGGKAGTGLGTYSARLIAGTLNGSISMSTAEHEGTTVTIRLPKAADEPETVSARRGAETGREAEHTEPEQMVSPPAEELNHLYRAVQIGDIMEIRKTIAQFEETLEPQYLPFVSRLRQLADELQMGAMLEFLHRHLNPEENSE